MWQFYQRLQPVQALSFDLDDTLYDNVPVILRAEQHVCDFIARQVPALAHLDVDAWRVRREQMAAENAELASNMTALRLATLRRTFTEFAVTNVEALSLAAMEEFLNARNQVDIDPQVHDLMAKLANHLPLVAISNGNVDVQKIGLAHYFQATFQPGEWRGRTLRGKPFTDMFVAAADTLQLRNPAGLLHIGDHPISDVQGAHAFGAQAVWLQPAASGRASVETLPRLPHATITRLQALADLLPR